MILVSVPVLLIVFVLIAVRPGSVKLHLAGNAFRCSVRSCSGEDFTDAVESVNPDVILF